MRSCSYRRSRLAAVLMAGLLAALPAAAQAPAGSVRLVADAVPGPGDLSPADLVRFGRYVYFVGGTDATGRELWRTDGTAAGTAPVGEVRPGPDDARIQRLTLLDDGLYFLAEPTDGDLRLYRVATDDGTPLLYADLPDVPNCSYYGSGTQLARLGGYVYFTACNATIGNELFRADAAGNVEGFDLTPGAAPYGTGPAGSSVFDFQVYDGRLYFAGGVGSVYEVFVFNGTGADLFFDADPRQNRNSVVSELVAFDGRLCFPGRTSDDFYGYSNLVCTDGTTAQEYAGTLPGETAPLGEGMYLRDLHVVGGVLYAHGGHTYQYEGGVWRFDGTALGLVYDEEPGQIVDGGAFAYVTDDSRLFRVAATGERQQIVVPGGWSPGWSSSAPVVLGGELLTPAVDYRGGGTANVGQEVYALALPGASDAPPPAPAAITSPAALAEGQTLFPRFRVAWTPVEGATGYVLEKVNNDAFYPYDTPDRQAVADADTLAEVYGTASFRVRAVRGGFVGAASPVRTVETTQDNESHSFDGPDPAPFAFQNGVSVDFASLASSLHLSVYTADSPPQDMPVAGLRFGATTWLLETSSAFASAEVCLPLAGLPAGLDPATAVVYKRPGPGTAWTELTPTLRPAGAPTDACVTVASFSEFGLGEAGGSLPVELVALTARVDGRTARLAWTTASETNNAGFTVEQQTSAGAWADASALIAGHGTTSERHDYAFDVAGLAPGRHTFRLRQSDTDGAVHHSAPVSVEVAAVRSGLVLLGSRAVRVELAEAEPSLRVALYDVLGRRVATLFEGSAEAGSVEASVPVGLASGVYLVRAEGARLTQTATLVLR